MHLNSQLNLEQCGCIFMDILFAWKLIEHRGMNSRYAELWTTLCDMHMVASTPDRMMAKIINRDHSTRKKLSEWCYLFCRCVKPRGQQWTDTRWISQLSQVLNTSPKSWQIWSITDGFMGYQKDPSCSFTNQILPATLDHKSACLVGKLEVLGYHRTMTADREKCVSVYRRIIAANVLEYSGRSAYNFWAWMKFKTFWNLKDKIGLVRNS
jgi:hypothetical protein